jgi:hypothetical protein
MNVGVMIYIEYVRFCGGYGLTNAVYDLLEWQAIETNGG